MVIAGAAHRVLTVSYISRKGGARCRMAENVCDAGLWLVGLTRWAVIKGVGLNPGQGGAGSE